jgi:hypothetical protein
VAKNKKNEFRNGTLKPGFLCFLPCLLPFLSFFQRNLELSAFFLYNITDETIEQTVLAGNYNLPGG